VIQMARKGTVSEFDIRNWKTSFYRNATQLEQMLLLELNAWEPGAGLSQESASLQDGSRV
jgi:hypothetical protein